MSLRPARRRWWRTSMSSGGRQASLCKHVRLVEEKQLVIYLQTRCQKTDIGPMIDGGAPDSGPIQKDRSKERTRQGETKVGGKAHPRGGEAADRGQGGICKRVPPGEVGPWVKGGGEDEAQPLQAGLWIEEPNYCDRVSALYRLFTPTTLTLVTHTSSHAML